MRKVGLQRFHVQIYVFKILQIPVIIKFYIMNIKFCQLTIFIMKIDNDIARSTRNTEIIFSHFEKAFQRLVVRVGSLERKYRNQDNEMTSKLNEESILSSIF